MVELHPPQIDRHPSCRRISQILQEALLFFTQKPDRVFAIFRKKRVDITDLNSRLILLFFVFFSNLRNVFNDFADPTTESSKHLGNC